MSQPGPVEIHGCSILPPLVSFPRHLSRHAAHEVAGIIRWCRRVGKYELPGKRFNGVVVQLLAAPPKDKESIGALE